jgi:hypothetical protein
VILAGSARDDWLSACWTQENGDDLRITGLEHDADALREHAGHVSTAPVIRPLMALERDFLRLIRKGASGAANNPIQASGWKTEASINGSPLFFGFA